jgi:hypothetical protein
MANYAEHGSVIGMRDMAGAWLPVLDTHAPNAAEGALLACPHAAFAQVTALVAKADLSAVMRLDDASLAGLVGAFYTLLSRETVLSEAFGASHFGEDMRVLRSLALVA